MTENTPYLIAGLGIRLLPGGVLQALYFCRMLNLLILFVAVILLIRLLRNASSTPLPVILFSVILLLMNPALWQLCNAMTTEAWKLFLICLGLYLAFHPGLTGRPRTASALFAVWLLIIVASRWTLIPFALVILAGALIRRNRSRSEGDRAGRSGVFFGLAVLLPLLLLPFVIETDILRHESRHVTSGLANLLSGKLDFLEWLDRLSTTFWAGFGWLNVPQTGPVSVIAPILSILLLILIGGYITVGFRRSVRCREPLWPIIAMGTVTAFLLVGIRGAAAESAVQGRYLYPAIPFLILGVARAMSLLPRYHRIVMTVCMILVAWLDLSGSLSGWIAYQHINYNRLKDPVLSLSQLTLERAKPAAVMIEPGNRHSDAFLGYGWYPAEPGAAHRWMMNHADVYLPFLQAADHQLQLRFLSFPAGNGSPMEMILKFNAMDLAHYSIAPGQSEGTVAALIPGISIRQGLNTLSIHCNPALSPMDLAQSPDRRYLSLAIRKLTLAPMCQRDPPEIQMSGYYALNGSKRLLRMHPGDELGDNRMHFEDSMMFRMGDGEVRRVWWDALGAHRLNTSADVTGIEYRQVASARAVERFTAFERSVSDLPGFLGDVYLHLLMIGFWLLVSAAAWMAVLGLVWVVPILTRP
ncbi:MAG TPA: DUF2142 domain-containing protein [bacterium]|nr:DUF2142 domain-containing protein [bacterium]